MLDGVIWRPFGATIYNSNIPQSEATIDARIDDALDLNLNILRVVNFMPAGTTENVEYTEANWAAIDYILHRCQQTGMKMLLDCSDYTAKEIARGTTTGNQDWTDFCEFVCNRVNTYNARVYKNDDTIAMITIAGELSGQNALEWPEFAEHATEMFDIKGANQLTGVGSIEWFNSKVDETAAVPTVDYIGTHPYDAVIPTDFEQHLAEYKARAELNNKPWLFEEFGSQALGGDSRRDAYMRTRYKQGLKYAVGGFLFWNLFPSTAQPTTSEDYNIGPNGNQPRVERIVKTYSVINRYNPRIPVAADDFANT